MRICQIIIYLGWCFCVNGQLDLNSIHGTKSSALGFTGVTFTELEASFHNPAGLVYTNKFSIGIFSEQKYLINDLNASALAFNFRVDDNSVFGAFVSSFGINEFVEQKMGIQFARQLSDPISLGVQLDYFRTQIENYGAKGDLAIELGLQSRMSKKLTLGFKIFVPFSTERSTGTNAYYAMRFGGKYSPNKLVNLYAEVQFSKFTNEQFHFGIDYKIVDKLALRIGSSTNPAVVGFGIAYRISSSMHLAGSFSQHPNLGLTPSFGLKYDK